MRCYKVSITTLASLSGPTIPSPPIMLPHYFFFPLLIFITVPCTNPEPSCVSIPIPLPSPVLVPTLSPSAYLTGNTRLSCPHHRLVTCEPRLLSILRHRYRMVRGAMQFTTIFCSWRSMSQTSQTQPLSSPPPNGSNTTSPPSAAVDYSPKSYAQPYGGTPPTDA